MSCQRPVPVGIASPVAYVTAPRETAALMLLLIVNLTVPDTNLVVQCCTVILRFLPFLVVVLVVLVHRTSSIFPALPVAPVAPVAPRAPWGSWPPVPDNGTAAGLP